MVCGDCVDKLARKLVEHHKLDLIRAYELAEKGLERYEKNKQEQQIQSLTEREKAALAFDPDYSQSCVCAAGNCSPGIGCDTPPDCRYCPTGTCPAPSKTHSSYVSNTCNCGMTTGCTCIAYVCGGTVQTCGTAGLCYYACDVGYVWNPVTLNCDLIVGGKILLKQVGVGL